MRRCPRLDLPYPEADDQGRNNKMNTHRDRESYASPTLVPMLAEITPVLSRSRPPCRDQAQACSPGFTEYYQTWLRHWRLDNSIIQRGVTSDNWSRPLAFFPKVVCRVSSRRGAPADAFRCESENAKYFTVVAELSHLALYIIQYLAQQMHFSCGVQTLLSIGSYALPLPTVTHNKH